jgi:biotin transport system substrate-specific component
MQPTTFSSSAVAQRAEALQRSIPGRVALAFAASLLVAVCAHVSLALPFTPVPITLQTFAVILVGMALGPATGFAAMLMYLAEGASGLPVFSPHGPGGIFQMIGPTGGFLFSYPFAAGVAGWVVRRAEFRGSKFSSAIFAGVAATVVIFTLGSVWIAQFGHLSAMTTWLLAIEPFLPGEAVKVIAAASIFSGIQRWSKY